ncbi:MAG: transposase, partial [Clostridiales Family XIII bacterium]|nr:transposase [Clostridiales Family XIII bacterium]
MTDSLKRAFTISLLCGIIAAICIQPAFAAGTKTVPVSLPDFAVTINEQEISGFQSGTDKSHANSAYPFIMYNGITYVPMTFFNSSLLGLTSVWDSGSGLRIEKRDVDEMGIYVFSPAASPNGKRQTAKITDIHVEVNGRVIDNANEPYPLLSFRDIVYLPLTWRFAVDEFGWTYSFDEGDGLSIYADGKFKATNEGMCYVRDGAVLVKINTMGNALGGYFGLAGPASANLMFYADGRYRQFGEAGKDFYGYNAEAEGVPWQQGIALSSDLRYEDGWIYTTWGNYWESIFPKPCKVNVSGNIRRDHIHLLLSCPPGIAPSKVVQYLKGRSSRLLQE